MNNNTKTINKQKTPISLKDVIYYNFFKKFGLNFDQKSLQQYHDAINDPKVLNVIQEDVKKLANVLDPVIQVTSDKIVTAWSAAVKKMQSNGLKTIVGALPVVGQVIDEVDNINRTINSGLEGINSVTGIVSHEVKKVGDTFEELNPIPNASNIVSGKLESAQNAVANTVVAPIQNLNNKVESAQNAVSNTIPVLEETNNSRLAAGGARILSRIKKSVKNFMDKKNANKKIINKKLVKTSKNINMKGGYNKNQNNIISQKGGQILSRIHKSLETFNKM